MTRVIWDEDGKRLFETGVDRGVLYPSDSDTGVPWNGLTKVSETPSGGEPEAYYIDGQKYMSVASEEEFEGTIEAYMYPDEFAECDGTVEIYPGLSATQQIRKPFSLTYRTGLGNDLEGLEYGYKIHIVYNALAAPTDKDYETEDDSTDPGTFSWAFSTLPVDASAQGLAPLSHLILDSTKISKYLLNLVESRLYGSATEDPTLLTLDELVEIFRDPPVEVAILPNYTTGRSTVTPSDSGDLIGVESVGRFRPTLTTRLTGSTETGLYTLE